ncbi:uncharacterized protein BP5553_07360 [Venustampulla echinocandica]|uniref:Arrestin-like N-terminal domain-containing protein n=1 Tax=Venustampulla echinocandica TaxID=2656787 RepID=A0A370TJ93_9HELO|nr:uncharacterized protein BP5553_07360 [Venustampulla echinocandica]RDL35429.1 hypothetical protein BP5553_07360 [Venustampulla echinocandica]
MDRRAPTSMDVRIILPEDTSSAKSSPEPPVRHCGDEIQGHLEVVCNSSFEFSIDISFEGLIRTWIAPGNENDSFKPPPTAEFQVGRIRITLLAHHKLIFGFIQKFLHETQKVFSDPSTRCYNSHLWIHRVPFRFIVPDELISPHSDIHPDFLKLSPSAKQGLVLLGFAQPSIIYLLRIKRIRTGAPVEILLGPNQQRELIVMPYTPAAPPLVIEDFPREYRPCTAKPLKQYRWGRPLGILEISSAEPSPLNILTLTPRTSTFAVLSVVFTSNSSCNLNARPSEWNFVVKQHLRSRTFYSTRRLDRMPTLAVAKADPYMRIRDEKKVSEVREYREISWRKERQPQLLEPTVSSDIEPCIWTTTLEVPIHAGKTLLPTFSNPLSAHQYTLALQLSIKGLYHGVMELVLPVQVFHYPPDDTRLRAYAEERNENLDEINPAVSRFQHGATAIYSSLRGYDTSPPPYDDL